MRKTVAIICLFTILLLCLSGCNIQGGNDVETTPQITATPNPDITENTNYVTEIWVAKEIEFTASKNVANINQAELDVTFTNRSTGTTITVPGFWDGEKSWKVRFAPTEYGIWDYVTRTTGEEIGLNGIKGTIAANTYKGNLEIYKRGFVRTDKDLKYFVYNDSTPFFYLGDTHWGMVAEEFNSAGDEAGEIKTTSHFKYIVDRRVAQGFTVYQSEPLKANLDASSGSVNLNNLKSYQNMDKYFEYIAQKGLVHANAQFFLPGTQTVTRAFIENLRSLTRFWVARYSAYPVMWTLGQECDNCSNFENNTTMWAVYIQMCQLISEFDPYNHPTTAHQQQARNITASGGAEIKWIQLGDGTTAPEILGTGYTQRSKFYGAVGHNWWASQWKPWLFMQFEFSIPRDYWENGEGKPAVNYEGKYHNLDVGDYGARAQAWITYLSGMCGYGYGAQGMWYYKSNYQSDQIAFDGIDIITPEMKQTTKWSDLIDAPISNELTILRGFLENVGWWKLVPDFDDGNAFKKVADKEGFYACAYDGNDVYVVYLYNRTVSSAGKLVNMDKNATYTAQWFDTRTGIYTPIDRNLKPDVNGEYDIPQKPVADDMVLLVTKH